MGWDPGSEPLPEPRESGAAAMLTTGMMTVAHVVPRISEEASGPSYSVPRLCESLALRGHAVSLVCLEAERTLAGVTVSAFPPWPLLQRFGISPAHARIMRRRADAVDIVHNHSLWSMVNVTTGQIVPGRRGLLVTSPRGTLSPWARSRSRALKRLLWPLQKGALVKAALIHATSNDEYEQVRATGIAAPVTVIPNGIDIPPLPGAPARLDGERRLLFLSRVHPVKGLENLIAAWATVAPRFGDWTLRIVGPGEAAYVESLRARVRDDGVPRVVFAGPVYGEDKSSEYLAADLFVLPSHTENFGMAVAEALAHACPAIVSRNAPWSGLETEGCGWWRANDAHSLAQVLTDALGRPRAALARMGEAGRAWMIRDFGWDSVAARMEASYAWALGRHDRPAHLFLY